MSSVNGHNTLMKGDNNSINDYNNDAIILMMTTTTLMITIKMIIKIMMSC